MKNYILLILGIFFVILGTCSGAVYAMGENMEVGLSQAFVSRYVWRGQDLYGDNDAAYQPSLNLTMKEMPGDFDLNFNLWGSFALSAGHEEGDELDYTVDVSKDINDTVALDLGFTYFDFPNLNAKADASELWLASSISLPWDISFDLFGAYDFSAASGGIDEGWYYSWGFSRDFTLPEMIALQEGQALSFSVTNWGNDGVADLEPAFIYATDITLSLPFAFGSFSVTPSLTYTAGYKEEINDGNDEFWAGIELSYDF